MRFVQGMGLFVLIALGLPAPKLPRQLARAIRESPELAPKVQEIEGSGQSLDALPVLPVGKISPGDEGIRCDLLQDGPAPQPVCLGSDAVYLTFSSRVGE